MRYNFEREQRPDSPSTLRAVESAEPAGRSVLVIANREPYAHIRNADGSVSVQRPASGLVTGIEPLLRASGGTWIAAATGSADAEFADAAGRLRVPIGAPQYTLRRLWFDEAEYEAYYSGFANEGLWPLCHTAHTRPSFRPDDWAAYESVNRAFARAAVEELERQRPAAARFETEPRLVLVQDYHFALVPRLIRNDAPQAVTNIFWHIPWPNEEVFGICPWKEALLDGMLGADVIGFHTRQYCLNFLESAQRYLECRVDFDEMSVSFGGRRTLVRAYPISVEWPYPAASAGDAVELRRAHGIGDDIHVSIGVDRADYTKGLVERMNAIELMLEQNPSLHGRYVHVQLASPTRSSIARYRELSDELAAAAARINARFATDSWAPILLQMRTFSPEEVRRYYAMAETAIVTPLHDGMNLVAKEYVASRPDCGGALVLSIFAGAAKELEGALLVNPYDVQQTASAIVRAIRMPAAERRARMEVMREQVASHSIFDWAEALLGDLKALRRHSFGDRSVRAVPQIAEPLLTSPARRMSGVRTAVFAATSSQQVGELARR